jgi:hypothetical protein
VVFHHLALHAGIWTAGSAGQFPAVYLVFTKHFMQPNQDRILVRLLSPNRNTAAILAENNGVNGLVLVKFHLLSMIPFIVTH